MWLVLVVDDVDINLYVTGVLLEPFGLKVEFCESGQVAIDKIKEGQTYDILFMDRMMPDLMELKLHGFCGRWDTVILL